MPVGNGTLFRSAQAHTQNLLLLALPTPIGRIRIAASTTGIVRVELPGPDAEARMNVWLALRFPHATRRRGVSPVLRRAAQQIEAYFTGSLRSFTVPLELAGTPFQLSVWKHVSDIAFGTTATYASIARAVHNPHALRAVGAAQAANPAPILVPCHRVVGSDGALVGYGGGLATKRWLLEHERVRLSTSFDAQPATAQLSLFHTPAPGRPQPPRPRTV